MKIRETTDVDRHIGLKIKERRVRLGRTQFDLATQLGITYQQQFKYEKAINRVSASRLYDIAIALNIEVSYFYEGLGKVLIKDVENGRMLLELNQLFPKMNINAKEGLLKIVRSLAEGAPSV